MTRSLLTHIHLIVFAGLVAASAGCSSSNDTLKTATRQDAGSDASDETSNNCNGVVDDAGNCVPKCQDSQCKAGNICVSNQCSLVCKGHSDCPKGWDCKPGVADSDGSAVNVCAPATYGFGEGEFFTSCPNGDECKEDAGYVCLGVKDDPDAFCSKWDCHTDEDCPGGFYCGIGRVFKKICDDPSFEPLIPPDPDEKCINKADMTADGHTYQKGPISLLRNLCLPRSYCRPCETDLDCSRTGYGVCVKTDDNAPGYCTRTCDKNLHDCPWQGASQCGGVDQSHGNVCNPTGGACVGDGSACSMCRNDLDCWKPGDKNRKACLRGTMSNEPYCVDMDFECSKSDDCPASPGGLDMQCLSDSVYSESLLYKRCYPGDNGLLQQGMPSCYPNPALQH